MEPGGEDHDPEQRDAESERGEDRYFQPASSARRLPLKPDEQCRGRGRRLDEQPGGAEVAGERDGEQHAPRTRRGARSRRGGRGGETNDPRRCRGTRARRARWRGRRAPITAEEQPAGGVDHDPCPPRSGRDREADGRADPRHRERAGETPSTTCRRDESRASRPRVAGAATTASARTSRSVTQAPRMAESPVPNSTKMRRWKAAATSAINVRSSATPSSITSDECAGQLERREREPVLDEDDPDDLSRVGRRVERSRARRRRARARRALHLASIEAERGHRARSGRARGRGGTGRRG